MYASHSSATPTGPGGTWECSHSSNRAFQYAEELGPWSSLAGNGSGMGIPSQGEGASQGGHSDSTVVGNDPVSSRSTPSLHIWSQS